MRFIGLFTLMVIGIFLVGLWRVWSSSSETVPSDTACTTVWREYVVRGDSMLPLLVHDEIIRVDQNYYHCHTPQVGEVVVLHHPHREAPLVKMVYAVAGDTLLFTPMTQDTMYHLQVNGVIAKTAGQPFVFKAEDISKIQAYIDAYAGTVPENYVLMLGLNQTGSLDSTEYGLYHYASLLGKVNIVR